MQENETSIDDTDRQLLTLLQEDGRMAYADLAQATGLSAAAARARVIRLQERGILQIVGVTDPLKLGFTSTAMIAISVTPGTDIEELADRIGVLEEVIYVVLVAGSIDLVVEVIAPDPAALFDIINRKIRMLEGVGTAETFTYYRTHTHRFTWGAL